MKIRKRNYSCHDLDLVVIVFALNTWGIIFTMLHFDVLYDQEFGVSILLEIIKYLVLNIGGILESL